MAYAQGNDEFFTGFDGAIDGGLVLDPDMRLLLHVFGLFEPPKVVLQSGLKIKGVIAFCKSHSHECVLSGFVLHAHDKEATAVHHGVDGGVRKAVDGTQSE